MMLYYWSSHSVFKERPYCASFLGALNSLPSTTCGVNRNFYKFHPGFYIENRPSAGRPLDTKKSGSRLSSPEGIVAAEALNFRVRNGIGCVRLAIAAACPCTEHVP